jgi:hypothetical protein
MIWTGKVSYTNLRPIPFTHPRVSLVLPSVLTMWLGSTLFGISICWLHWLTVTFDDSVIVKLDTCFLPLVTDIVLTCRNVDSTLLYFLTKILLIRWKYYENSASTGRIIVQFLIWGIFRYSVDEVQVSLKSIWWNQRDVLFIQFHFNSGTVNWHNMHAIYQVPLVKLLLRMKK